MRSLEPRKFEGIYLIFPPALFNDSPAHLSIPINSGKFIGTHNEDLFPLQLRLSCSITSTNCIGRYADIHTNLVRNGTFDFHIHNPDDLLTLENTTFQAPPADTVHSSLAPEGWVADVLAPQP